MLSRKTAGTVLFLSFLTLCSVAAAKDAGGFRDRDAALAGANLNLTLSPSSAIGCESGLTDGLYFSGAWPRRGTWTMPIVAHGMEGYVLTAVVTGTDGAGFMEVALQSTTATEDGYFGDPIVLASNPVPTSFVAEPSTASFMIAGIFFTGSMLRRRKLA